MDKLKAQYNHQLLLNIIRWLERSWSENSHIIGLRLFLDKTISNHRGHGEQTEITENYIASTLCVLCVCLCALCG